MSNPWPFADPPETPVLTTREVAEEHRAPTFVRHDADDGSWQIHVGEGLYSPDDARVTTLHAATQLDATLLELAGLPAGWVAVRNAPGNPWRRLPQEEWDRLHGG